MASILGVQNLSLDNSQIDKLVQQVRAQKLVPVNKLQAEKKNLSTIRLLLMEMLKQNFLHYRMRQKR